MYTSLFFVGSMLITFRFEQARNNIVKTLISLSGLVLGLYLAGFHPASGAYVSINSATRALSAYTGYQPYWMLIVPAAGGLIILLSVLNSQKIFSVLDSTPMKWLGKLSFSVYLLHTFALVITGQLFTKHLGMGVISMFLTLASTLFITLIASYLFYLKVDNMAIRLANRFSAVLLGRQGVDKDCQPAMEKFTLRAPRADTRPSQ